MKKNKNLNSNLLLQTLKFRLTLSVKNLSSFAGALALLLLFVSGKALAQTAPPFSSDMFMDNKTFSYLIFDRLEYSSITGPDPLVLDAQGWIGKDFHKFWFKIEGDAQTAEKEGEMEIQGLYSRGISSYFDFQAGLRYDVSYDAIENNSRGFAVVGIQGLAPYLFEVDGSVQLSQDGDISASLEGELDLLVTQRIIAQPRFTTNLALQEVEEWGVGSGVNDIQLGFRLRYEIRREFAPYFGFSWNRQIGQTADFTKDSGGEASNFGLVGGVRMWF